MVYRNRHPDPPSDDKRWLIINATMRRHGYQADALIETLHTVQSVFGYLDKPTIEFVADSLSLPKSQAYGVATFYHFFSMKPMGAHSCVVCTGTACYIKGSDAIMKSITNAFDVADGETTADGQLSLLTARCLGACGLAPAVVVDGQVMAHMTPETTVDALENVTQAAPAEAQAEERVSDGA